MPLPTRPKIYHIVHVDNLASIVADGCLRSDSVMAQRQGCIAYEALRSTGWLKAA